MKTGELIKYLSRFPKNSTPSIITVNLEKRVVYPFRDSSVITDMDCPVFIMEVGEGEDMDEGDRKCTGVQMELKFEQ